MKEKTVKIEVSNLSYDSSNVEIIGRNQDYSLTMYADKDIDPKTFSQFIRKVERLVRGSSEYKEYIRFLREEEGLDYCVYLKNINVTNAEIQLHHVITNLYMICSTVFSKLISEGKKVSTFILADEVLKLHLDNKVALVPLSVTMHELAHSVDLKIPSSVIYGDYMSYYEMYNPFMEKYERQCFEEIFQLKCLTKENVLKVSYE